MVKDYKIKENKYLEIQSEWCNGWTKILSLDLSIKFTDCDHPGWTFNLEIFKLWFFQIVYYDTRHWDRIEDERNN